MRSADFRALRHSLPNTELLMNAPTRRPSLGQTKAQLRLRQVGDSLEDSIEMRQAG